MDYQPLLDRFKADLLTLKTKITELAQGERPTAKYAENVDFVEGQGVTAIRTVLAGPLAEHIAADNPHQDGPANIDIYSKTAIDTALNNLIGTGILPITRFGSAGYLPVGVGGSFETGTHIGNQGFLNTPVVMEEDGTLVYLRNATDGATRGVYYSYLANARSADLSKVVLTNKRYRPAWLPANKEVLQVYRGNKDAILGVMADLGTTNNQQLFISLCNGTFDESKHAGGVVPLSVYDPNVSRIHEAAEPIIVGSSLFFLRALTNPLGAGNNAQFAIDVYSIPISQIQNNAITSWTQVTGWNCTGFKQTKTAQTRIVLADKVASSNNSDDAAIIVPPELATIVPDVYPMYGNGAMTWAAKDPASTKVRVTLVGLARLFPNAASFFTTPIVCSFVLDVGALTAVVDDSFRGGTTISLDGNNNFLFSNANWRAVGAGWATGTSNMYSGHNQVITDDGYAFVMSVSNATEQTNSLYRAKIAAFVNPYATIVNSDAFATSGGYRWILSKGPGPVMNGIRALNILPGGYFNLISKGDGTYRPSIIKYRDTGESPTTAYKSVSGANMVGFSPKSDRRYVSDVAGAVQPSPLLTELGTDLNVSSCRAILSTSRLSARLNWDQNLQTSGGTISVTAAALVAVAQAMWTMEGFAGAPKSSWTQLIVPANAALPPIAISWMIGSDGTTYMMVYRITTQARSGAIGTLGVVAKISTVVGPVGTATTVTPMEDGICWGSQICQTANGYIYTIGGQVVWPKSTGGYFQQMVFWMNLDLTTEGFRWFEILRTASRSYVCLPGYGPGLLSNDGTDSDFITKLMFQPWGTGKANVINPPADARASKIVTISQQVPGGFNVYFTEDTPFFISGKQYTLPPQAIDLRNVTPSPGNKKFFVYAQLKQGNPVYVIRETELAESDTNVYIGYVQTNSLAIATIYVSKVDRIDNYRLSTSPAGSAIPVSVGNPYNAAQVTW